MSILALKKAEKSWILKIWELLQVNKKIDSPKYKIAQRTGLVIHKRKNKYLIKKEHLTLLFLNVQQINIVPCETDRKKHK